MAKMRDTVVNQKRINDCLSFIGGKISAESFVRAGFVHLMHVLLHNKQSILQFNMRTGSGNMLLCKLFLFSICPLLFWLLKTFLLNQLVSFTGYLYNLLV